MWYFYLMVLGKRLLTEGRFCGGGAGGGQNEAGLSLNASCNREVAAAGGSSSRSSLAPQQVGC